MWKISLVLLSVMMGAAFSVFAGGGQAAAEGNVVIVETKKFKFIPGEITVKVGTTVRWLNTEKRQYHSVWFREMGEPSADYFFPGESVERTFNKVGDFPYVCEPHEIDSKMTGIVHVVE